MLHCRGARSPSPLELKPRWESPAQILYLLESHWEKSHGGVVSRLIQLDFASGELIMSV